MDSLREDQCYHFLSSTFCQCIAVAQIINFNIFDVVAIGDIHVTVEGCCTRRARGFPGILLLG